MVAAAILAGALVVAAGDVGDTTDAADTRTSVVVFNFEPVGEIEGKVIAAFSDRLLLNLRSFGEYREVGQTDIEAMIEMEELQLQTGCIEFSCMVELAGAVGVDLLVTGSIVVDEDAGQYQIIAKVVHSRNARVEGRSEHVTALDTNALLAGADTVAALLFGREPPPPPPPREIPGPIEESRRSHMILGWSGVGIAAVAITVGAILVGSAFDKKGQADRAYSGYRAATDPNVATAIHQQVNDLIGEHNTFVSAGYPLLGLGAAAIAVAAYGFIAMPSIETSVQVTPGGAAFILGGRF